MTGKEILEQLGKVGIDGMKELGEWIHGAKEFVVEQAPLICQEILNRGTIQACICIAVFVISIVFLVIVAKFARKKFVEALKGNSYYDDADAGWYCCMVLSIIVTICCSIGFFYNLYMVLYIQLCPRLYILEQLAKVVKDFTK